MELKDYLQESINSLSDKNKDKLEKLFPLGKITISKHMIERNIANFQKNKNYKEFDINVLDERLSSLLSLQYSWAVLYLKTLERFCDNCKFVNLVRYYRMKSGMSGAELAEKAGICSSRVHAVERIYSRNNGLTLEKISEALDIEIKDLMYEK